MFAVEIEKGARPTAALKGAFDKLDEEHSNIDDKTLRRHIMGNL